MLLWILFIIKLFDVSYICKFKISFWIFDIIKLFDVSYACKFIILFVLVVILVVFVAILEVLFETFEVIVCNLLSIVDDVLISFKVDSFESFTSPFPILLTGKFTSNNKAPVTFNPPVILLTPLLIDINCVLVLTLFNISYCVSENALTWRSPDSSKTIPALEPTVKSPTRVLPPISET